MNMTGIVPILFVSRELMLKNINVKCVRCTARQLAKQLTDTNSESVCQQESDANWNSGVI